MRITLAVSAIAVSAAMVVAGYMAEVNLRRNFAKGLYLQQHSCPDFMQGSKSSAFPRCSWNYGLWRANFFRKWALSCIKGCKSSVLE